MAHNNFDLLPFHFWAMDVRAFGILGRCAQFTILVGKFCNIIHNKSEKIIVSKLLLVGILYQNWILIGLLGVLIELLNFCELKTVVEVCLN